MAGHELIAAQLDILAVRLPAQAVEELADGLHEAYEHQLRRHGDPDTAARLAIAGRRDGHGCLRASLALAAHGPRSAGHRSCHGRHLGPGADVGAGVDMAATHASQDPVWPRRLYSRTRVATIGGALGLVLLDGLMVTAVLVAAAPVWPMAVAVPASLIRNLAVVRALPAVLAV